MTTARTRLLISLSHWGMFYLATPQNRDNQ